MTLFSNKSIKIPEIPVKPEIELDARSTALVIVDMQNDFVGDGGSLQVPGAAATVEPIARLLQTARDSQVRVVFTQDTHREGDLEWGIWPRHCEEGSWGWQIVDRLKPEGGELVCPKNRYDGFYGTWLEHYLSRVWKVQSLVVVGTVSNICVLHTAASAGLRWFDVVIPADGISALTEFDQAACLRQVTMLYNGRVVERVEQLSFCRDWQ